MFVREFQHPDRAQCAALYELAWNDTFPDLQRSISPDQFEDETKGERILIAEIDGKVVGFASLWEPEAFLHHLHVSPDYHRRGIGTSLLERVLKLANSHVSLKCQVENRRALEFYRHHGFEAAGESGADSYGKWERLVRKSGQSP